MSTIHPAPTQRRSHAEARAGVGPKRPRCQAGRALRPRGRDLHGDRRTARSDGGRPPCRGIPRRAWTGPTRRPGRTGRRSTPGPCRLSAAPSGMDRARPDRGARTEAGALNVPDRMATAIAQHTHERNCRRAQACRHQGSDQRPRDGNRAPVDYDLQSPVRHPWHGWCLNTESGDRDGLGRLPLVLGIVLTAVNLVLIVFLLWWDWGLCTAPFDCEIYEGPRQYSLETISMQIAVLQTAMAGIGLGLAVAGLVGFYALEKVAENRAAAVAGDRAVDVAQRAVQKYLDDRNDPTDNQAGGTPRSDQGASAPREDITKEED